jgi:hypothetical protein
LRYIGECNSRASYLSVQDQDGIWTNVYSRDELKELLNSIKNEIAT